MGQLLNKCGCAVRVKWASKANKRTPIGLEVEVLRIQYMGIISAGAGIPLRTYGLTSNACRKFFSKMKHRPCLEGGLR